MFIDSMKKSTGYEDDHVADFLGGLDEHLAKELFSSDKYNF